MIREDLEKLNAAMQGLDRWREVPSVEAAYQLLKEVREKVRNAVEWGEELELFNKRFQSLPKVFPDPFDTPKPFIDIDDLIRSGNNVAHQEAVKTRGCPNAGSACFCTGICREPVTTNNENLTLTEVYTKELEDQIKSHREKLEKALSEPDPMESLTKEDIKIIIEGDKTPIVKLWKVNIIEAERGWGRKVEDVRWFATKREAEDFIKDYNKELPDVAPDYYWQAEGPIYVG